MALGGATCTTSPPSASSIDHIKRLTCPSRTVPSLSISSRSLTSTDGRCRLSSSSKPIPTDLLAVSSSASSRSGVDEHLADSLTDEGPASIKLEPIISEERFDGIIAEAQQLEEEFVILWMAKWCRKCIYLKPKLEKLAADYYPRIRFYCIDVNSVPQKLVNRAGVTKMPTIQLWKDCKKQAEVVGGHKAWLVVNDVRQMIENQYY